jgi:hypothetical protein
MTDHTNDSPMIETLTMDEFQAILARELPVLAFAQYGYGKPEDNQSMLHIWIEVDPNDPALASLRDAMELAILNDSLFEMDYTVVADFRLPMNLDEIRPLYWDVAFRKGQDVVAAFSFAIHLPIHALELATIADEGCVTICPIPPASELAQRIKGSWMASIPSEVGSLPAETRYTASLNFPLDQPTTVILEGFTIDVPNPEILTDWVILYYELVGVDVSAYGMLKDGDIPFSEAR